MIDWNGTAPVIIGGVLMVATVLDEFWTNWIFLILGSVITSLVGLISLQRW